MAMPEDDVEPRGQGALWGIEHLKWWSVGDGLWCRAWGFRWRDYDLSLGFGTWCVGFCPMALQFGS